MEPIEPTDIQRILVCLVHLGKTRQVNKLRSYLHAAFAYAGKHDNDPRRRTVDSVGFDVRANPAVLVPRVAAFDRVSDRVLTEGELRLFWRALDQVPAVFLRFNPALGGQRIEQVLRARNAAASHPVVSQGQVRMDVTTPSKVVQRISDQLRASHGLTPFRPGDLRRTCETLLASLAVPKEILARLLSHGRSIGVQAKHYDHYAHLPEKRRAPETWAAFLQRLLAGDDSPAEPTPPARRVSP